MNLRYCMTDKFKTHEPIPFNEGTKLWHVWCDVCTTHGDREVLNLERMMRYHGTDSIYYADALKELEASGFLELRGDQ